METELKTPIIQAENSRGRFTSRMIQAEDRLSGLEEKQRIQVNVQKNKEKFKIQARNIQTFV